VSRWKTLYRYPATGPPLILIQESPTGLVVKSPLASNLDHVTITKETKGIGKHLTDETVKAGIGRQEPLGKLTAATFPTALLDSLSVEIRDEEEVFIPDLTGVPRDHQLQKKDLPGPDLVLPDEVIRQLETTGLDTLPVLRRVTWGQARALGLPGGIRREGDELVFLVQRRNGKVIRLPLAKSKQYMPIVAEASGIGALFERARRRLPDSPGEGSGRES
jgi:hypothetical protein